VLRKHEIRKLSKGWICMIWNTKIWGEVMISNIMHLLAPRQGGWNKLCVTNYKILWHFFPQFPEVKFVATW
jgi:hypothetical protein